MGVNFRDIVTRLKAPPEILQAMQKNESFSQSGSMNRREVEDFVLEGKNREKLFAPPDVLSHGQWRNVCRLLDALNQVTVVSCTCITYRVAKHLCTGKGFTGKVCSFAHMGRT